MCEPVCQSFSALDFRMKAVAEFSVRSKALATVAAVALTIALGVLDYVTGREWAISAFYLLPTGIAGWVAGRLAGFVWAAQFAASIVRPSSSGRVSARPVGGRLSSALAGTGSARPAHRPLRPRA